MSSHRSLLPLSLSLLAVAAPCQRQDASLEWLKRASTLTYGAVPLGQHALEELPVGQTWRLGMNEPSTWTTALPVVAEGRVLPPGAYRIHLHRLEASRCAVVAEGSGQPGGGEDFRALGAIERVKKPSKKLAMEWQKGASKDKVTLPAALTIQFGENLWRSDLALIGGGKPTACGGMQLTVFSLPAELVAARGKAQVPVALLTDGKGKSQVNYNLMLGDGKARLVPWLDAPRTLQDAVPKPDADKIVEGTCETSAADGEEVAQLRLDALTADKQKATLQLSAGKEKLKVEFFLPGAK